MGRKCRGFSRPGRSAAVQERTAILRAMMRYLAFIAAALAVAGPTAHADEFPAGPAHDKVAQASTQCHGGDVIAGQRLSRDGWADTVARMVANGAQISEADQPRIVDYLAANFPAK
jgi:hypothetical protein